MLLTLMRVLPISRLPYTKREILDHTSIRHQITELHGLQLRLELMLSILPELYEQIQSAKVYFTRVPKQECISLLTMVRAGNHFNSIYPLCQLQTLLLKTTTLSLRLREEPCGSLTI